MKMTKKQIGIASAVLLVLSAVLAVFRINVLNRYTNPVNGLYTDKAVGAAFFVAFSVLVVLGLCIYFPARKIGYKAEKQNDGVVIKVISLLLGIAFAAIFAVGISSGSKGILHTMQSVLCVPSAVYFCMKASDKDKQDGFMGIWALFPAIWAGIRTIALFIDTTTQINASQRSFTLVFLVFVMMCLLSEAEFFVPLAENEKEEKFLFARTAKFAVLSLVTAELAVMVIIPGFITSFGALSLYEVLSVILDAIIAVYAAVRLFSLK